MIQRLPQAVVQQIAAGEVIVSPRNALKELLENALDAGATRVEVQVNDNGFGLLSVKDNGHGISKKDLELLCMRFATSKLADFGDLTRISTLGFRGEALSSISHVANLSVVTKQSTDSVATRAVYSAGELVKTEKIAGLNGTTINVENIFYNNPTRRQALSATGKAEYSGIMDIVARYAIRYPGTFTCKQTRDAQPTVIPDGDTKSKIQSVFGSALASHLTEINVEALEYGFSASGYVSNLEYAAKSVPFILFVNGRLVECKPLFRAIVQVYTSYVARASTFVYLNLNIDPQNVDVNTHPTKSMVTFLYQDEIVDLVAESLNNILKDQAKARVIAAQTVLTSTLHIPDATPRPSASSSSQRYEHKLVRTDPKQSTLAFSKSTVKTSQPAQLSPRKSQRLESLEQETACEPGSDLESVSDLGADPELVFESQQEGQDPEPELHARGAPRLAEIEPSEVNLRSIAELRDAVNRQFSSSTTKFLMEHTYIGLVDPRRSLVAIQYDVRLYLADYHALSQALFYQIGLLDFANFGTIHLGDGISVLQLLQLAQARNKDKSDEPIAIAPMLESMAPMLEDYFKIKLHTRNGELLVTQMPLLLAGYTPSIARLPEFFLQVNHVQWKNERECLDAILHALAKWCIPVNPTNKELKLIFGAFKSRIAGMASMQKALVEIASLPGLYKVFERC